MSTGIDVEAAVSQFMESCGQGVDVGRHTRDLRLALIEEEFTEFLEALDWGDPVHIAKEACDLVYVVVGTLVSLGIPFNDSFAILQQSNMSKVGPDGQVTKRADGKILKGEHYVDAEEGIRKLIKEG